MQLGVFAAIPLVADREKLILKRLQATPLRRWQLVGSNVVMRLLIAIVQTAIIVGVGSARVRRPGRGQLAARSGRFVVLGSLTFIALGYVIASFASTEESANGMTSVVQFPLMFLSGTFFPIDAMPDALQAVARAMPLTYLGDALRQVMVGGTPFSPLWVCFAVLARLARGLLRDRARGSSAGSRSAIGRRYQRSSWTISSSGRRGRRAVRRGELRRVGRVAERQQVLAVVGLGVAEQAASEVVLVDRRRNAADARAPRPRASCTRPPGRDRT